MEQCVSYDQFSELPAVYNCRRGVNGKIANLEEIFFFQTHLKFILETCKSQEEKNMGVRDKSEEGGIMTNKKKGGEYFQDGKVNSF